MTGGGQDFENSAAEIGEIVGLPGGDEVAVDDDRGVFEDRPGVFEIVANAGRASDADTAVDARRDRNPAAVTDRRDQLASVGEMTRQRFDDGIAAELIGRKAAWDDEAREFASDDVFERGVADAGIAMLARVLLAGLWPGHHDVGAGLDEPKLGVPEFEVFVDVIDEHQQLGRSGGVHGEPK